MVLTGDCHFELEGAERPKGEAEVEMGAMEKQGRETGQKSDTLHLLQE